MTEASKVVVGQRVLLERLVMALLCEGHVLLEGLPGLAKTLTIKTLSDVLEASFQRIQFTPDLLPSDVVGTVIFSPKTGDFVPKKGPIFANLVLADEINRAPAKVQSALLEAMGERQVTIGETSYALPKPFVVLATQNPIEQEGTYPLPEAQLDRFLFKVKVGYPSLEDEKSILNRMGAGESPSVKNVVKLSDVLSIQHEVLNLHIDEKIKDYILQIVFATRFPEKYKLPGLKKYIQVGASPRATLSLVKAARAHAFLRKRNYVIPEDVRNVVLDVCRHRLVLSFDAEAENVTADDCLKQILEVIPVP